MKQYDRGDRTSPDGPPVERAVAALADELLGRDRPFEIGVDHRDVRWQSDVQTADAFGVEATTRPGEQESRVEGGQGLLRLEAGVFAAAAGSRELLHPAGEGG